MWIDAHCHLAQPGLMDDIDAVLERSRAAGVGGWVQGGVEPSDWQRQRSLAARFDGVVTAYGLHPWWASLARDDEVDAALDLLEEKLPEAALVGEAGLDKAVRGLDDAGYRRQKAAFSRQLRLARAAGKPMVLHAVRADGDFLELLSESGGLPAGGIVHAFNGGPDTATACIKMGLFLSVNGAVARPGFRKLKEALRVIPRECLLIETDAPDGPLDAARREPRDLPRVAAAVGALLGVSGEVLLDASAAALRRLLGKGA